MRRTLTVAAKELRESLRESHVLTFSIGFPLLFWPMAIWGSTQAVLYIAGTHERTPPRVAMQLDDAVQHPLPGDLAPMADGVHETLAEPPLVPQPWPADPNAALHNKDVDVLVELAPTPDGHTATLRYLSTSGRSNHAHAVVAERLDLLAEARVTALEQAHGLDDGALARPTISREDSSPDGGKFSRLIAGVLPMLILSSLWMSAIYPAVEMVVGERERGTLETTLVASVSRGRILLGKLLAVLALVLISTIGNGAAVTLTLVHTIASLDAGDGFSLAVDWPALALSAPALLATALLGAGVCMLAALPTRTFRQAQNTVSMVSMVGLLPSFVGVMPAVDLTWPLVAIPVVNVALVMRDAIGSAGLDPAKALAAAAVNGALAAVVLYTATRVVNREDFLFGGQTPRWLAAIVRRPR